MDQPRFVWAIQQLVAKIARDLGVDRKRIVLVGSSKGATGAVYHGLYGEYSFVAVDPVLSDRYYEEQQGDRHYTRGALLFLRRKEEVFEGMKGAHVSDDVRAVFLTSRSSEQFASVEDFACSLSGDNVSLMVADYSAIRSHPDVARGTLGVTVSAVTACLLGWGLPLGVSDVSR